MTAEPVQRDPLTQEIDNLIHELVCAQFPSQVRETVDTWFDPRPVTDQVLPLIRFRLTGETVR